MTGSARAFLASMDRSLASLPGATAIGLHTGTLGLWKHYDIYAGTDDAFRALSLEFGLGAPMRVGTGDRYWLRAEASGRKTQIVVIGPLEISSAVAASSSVSSRSRDDSHWRSPEGVIRRSSDAP